MRAIFRAKDAHEAQGLLDAWLKATAYCRIAPVVAVEKKVRRRRADVIAAVNLGTGNGRVESINQKIKVTIASGYGFRNTDNLIALIMLRCPGRTGRRRSERGTSASGRTGNATGRGARRGQTRRRLPSRAPGHTNYRRL